MRNSSLTKALNITHPIIQAPMAGGITTPELVAAVSNAGALGSIGAGYMTPEALQKAIQETKALTDRPFSVNLFVPDEGLEVTEEELRETADKLDPFLEELGTELGDLPTNFAQPFHEQLDVVIREQIPIASFTFGIPSDDIIARLKEANVFVIGTATTVNEALELEKAGMDAIVAQGSEAGGHRGTFQTSFAQAMVGTIALVPQMADHVNVPLIAAGGIMDARGVLAAEVLGASAVQLGTAFLTCKESGAHPLHQETILESYENSTVVTSVFSGKPARGINNRFIEEMNDESDILPYPVQNALTNPLRQEASKQENIQFMSLWAGQGIRLSKRTSAQQLIDEIVRDLQTLKEAIQS